MLNSSIVVFPTSRAIREELSSLKQTNQLLKKYITIADLFQMVILDKSNKKFIDKNLKILYLKEAIENSNIEKLGLSSDFSTFLKQSDYIFRFFLETANEYVDIDSLLQYDTYILYSDHIEILKEVHKNYLDILDLNGYTDNIILPKNYTINTNYLEQFNDLSFYLEGYLTAFEFKIIKDISKHIKTNIYITLNEFNQKNIKLFSSIDEELKLDHTYKIDITNNKIIQSQSLEKIKQNILISPIQSQLEQIAFIKYQITQMISDGIEASKIAVLIPNEQLSKMLELFDNEHYFNFAMGRGIKDNKIVQVVKFINKILIDQEPKDKEKFKYLKIDNDKFINLFKNNYNKIITKDLFDEIVYYLFSFENDDEVLLKLELIKATLEVLLFTSIEKKFTQLKVKEFLKLFINQIFTISVDDVSGGKITVLGILETRLIQYDGIIVVDFNDDKIPKISIKDKFISTNLKKQSGLPTVIDRENLQRYYYKRFFDKAKSIAICYVDDEQSVMSRFVMQLFTNYKDFIVKKDYKSILYNKNELKHFNQETILDIDLSKRSWSATSLKSYLECKRKYYFNYIKNIKEHTISIKPQNYEIGNIIHTALETAVKQNTLNTEFINKYLTDNQQNNPYLVLELELWKKKLENFFKYEKNRKQNGIEIFEVEQPFNLTYNGVNLKGKIDRIDKYPDNTYEILDYKTGTSLKIDTLKSYEESTDFQLEFYYIASRDKMINSVGYYMLNDCTIRSEVVLKEKLLLLEQHLKALKTTKVNFKQTDNFDNCKFCSYKVICQRDG